MFWTHMDLLPVLSTCRHPQPHVYVCACACAHAHVCTGTCTHMHKHTGIHTPKLAPPHTCAWTQGHTCGPTATPMHPGHHLPQKMPLRPASARASRSGRQQPCPSDSSPLGPQALLALPQTQTLEEVLVVVGGRALEEDEEGAEEPAPHPGNFAFYNTKASE